MAKFIYVIFLCSITASAFADINSYINVEKISKIAKELVHKRKKVDVDDLTVDFISTMVSPKSGFVIIETQLHQNSSKKKLIQEEIEKSEPKETNPQNYSHYSVTAFEVRFNRAVGRNSVAYCAVCPLRNIEFHEGP